MVEVLTLLQNLILEGYGGGGNGDQGPGNQTVGVNNLAAVAVVDIMMDQQVKLVAME